MKSSVRRCATSFPVGELLRRPGVRVGITLLGLAGVAIPVVDHLGLKPLPSAEAIRSRMQREWSQVESYRAFVSVRHEGEGGNQVNGIQVRLVDGSLGYVEASMGGFSSRGQLRANRWHVEYPEARTRVTYEIQDLDQVPYGRWYLTGSPALPDLIEVLNSATSLKAVDWGISPYFRHLSVDVLPRMPESAARQTPELRAFYQTYLSEPWRVSVDRDTGLPREVRIGQSSRWRVGIRFRELDLQRRGLFGARHELPEPNGGGDRYRCWLAGEPRFSELQGEVVGRVRVVRNQLLRGQRPVQAQAAGPSASEPRPQ